MTRRVLAMPLLCIAAACSTPGLPVPDQLKPPAGESPIAALTARGVQIYECRARTDDAQASEWAFVAPQAELFDAGGRPVGKHYAGPHWESSDGSKVIGSVKARADAPQPGAIPWLLLATRSDGPAGAFAGVTSVQRVNTAGGTAPAAAECAAATRGREARVAYSAEYLLFGSR